MWSAGCASGEEACSIAILLAEHLGVERFRQRVKIYATDVDEEALGQARQATYSPKEVDDVPPALLEKYFERTTNHYIFHKELRRSVIFGRHDLVQDAPISRIQLLLCRNTLMYLNTDIQSRILGRFHFALNGGGFLFLGKAEMLVTHTHLFSPVDLKRRVFLKMPSDETRARLLRAAVANHEEVADHMMDNTRLRDLVLETDPIAQLVVDTSGVVTLMNERLRALFGLTADDLGRPLRDLAVSYRPANLRSAIEEATSERRAVVRKDVAWSGPSGEQRFLDITVLPLFDVDGGLLGMKIVFVDTTTYKRLQEELHQSKQALETAYEELQSSNEELETTNEELQSTNHDLQSAARAKDQFIAMLGHELRNPIAAVRQAVHALERLGAPGVPATALHGIIDRQTRHLARLVDDLLDVARLTSGKITLRKQPVDLRDTVERSLGTLAPARQGHDLTLDGDRVVVVADPTRLEQIVGNLLENALKYTPAGGRIEVTTGRANAAGILRIRDTGIGIPPEMLPRIFEPFAQADQPLAREPGGLGIGLTLTRQLVMLHGGTISLTSAGPGQGTTVEVWLPVAPSAAPAPAELPPAIPRARRPQSVLIVEDNPDVREALRWLLESESHQVRTARHGHEAIELVRRSRPDVAFVDIGLPGMNGYELARQLRAMPGGGSIRLVALTGYGHPEDRRRTREAGYETHLVKPVEPDELMRLLAEA